MRLRGIRSQRADPVTAAVRSWKAEPSMFPVTAATGSSDTVTGRLTWLETTIDPAVALDPGRADSWK